MTISTFNFFQNTVKQGRYLTPVST